MTTPPVSSPSADSQATPKMKLRFRVIPPMVLLALLLVCVALDYAWEGWPVYRQMWLGAAFLFLGTATELLCVWMFWQAKTYIMPHSIPRALLTLGPYAITRNPIYLSMVATLVGMALIAGSLPYYLAPPVFWLIIHKYFVPMEERNLELALGQSYLAYKRRVRRWI